MIWYCHYKEHNDNTKQMIRYLVHRGVDLNLQNYKRESPPHLIKLSVYWYYNFDYHHPFYCYQ